MLLLTMIWTLSLTLAVASILIMAQVILRRWFENRRVQISAAENDKARSLLLDSLAGNLDDAATRGLLAQHAPATLIEAAADLIGLIDAADRDRLRVLARQLDLTPYRAALRHRRKRGCLRAVHVLSAVGEKSAVPDLCAMLDDPDPHIRLGAAKGLVDLDALPPLVEVMDKLGVIAESHPRVLFSIFRSLALQRSAEMLALIREDAEDYINVIAIDALEHTGDIRHAPRISGALSFPSIEVRAAVLRALGRLGDRRMQSAVRTAMSDPAWEIRCQAAVCAGRLKLVDTAAELQGLLEDPEWWVRFRAAEALNAFGDVGLGILRDASRLGGPARDVAQTVLEETAA